MIAHQHTGREKGLKGTRSEHASHARPQARGGLVAQPIERYTAHGQHPTAANPANVASSLAVEPAQLPRERPLGPGEGRATLTTEERRERPAGATQNAIHQPGLERGVVSA